MERRARRVSGPQALAFPACFRIVDAPIQSLRVEVGGIRNAQRHPFAVDDCHQRILAVARGDWGVLAETERVELIDPGIVTPLRATTVGDTLELRRREWVERPPL